jgi:hypothetical protein
MQIFINGLVSGAAIALLAVAFQAVYLPTRVFFIGLAGIYSATPFIAHAVMKAGGPGWLLPEALRFLHLPDAQAANLRMLTYGLLLVLMMHFRPQGIAGEYRME